MPAGTKITPYQVGPSRWRYQFTANGQTVTHDATAPVSLWGQVVSNATHRGARLVDQNGDVVRNELERRPRGA
jgi:hypothetical protein